MVLMVQCLDYMVLVVFFSINDQMILSCISLSTAPAVDFPVKYLDLVMRKPGHQ